ncbi:hypothetical protein NO559_07735 [Dasania sp. GY-MA-18]|uniref:Uncharacterized protein n=1 Tax=Dasania phycosphaerae TaxID=2950436 RepID=A0A9J6RLM4_9GAMM|nr:MULTISPECIES: hypothetical protein [Dasania]MCR8922657.1 hypothetical protein [Dasania sp. GY-MA-18]MCZ0865087.1 hypothetical protein [Dasania phycosphaerae]MCZ0868813.1 hypothetical protein [Dasania phycosphaerae]
MPDSMTKTQLVADLRLALSDAESFFSTADANQTEDVFWRMLTIAASDMHRARPRTLSGSLALIAGVASYPAPADLEDFKLSNWGMDARARYNPWDGAYPRRLPTVTVIGDSNGKTLELSFAPTSPMITVLGATYGFFYYGQHTLPDDGSSSINESDRELLILRATAEAMKQLAIKRLKTAVSVKPGVGRDRQGSPAEIYQNLMIEFLAA